MRNRSRRQVASWSLRGLRGNFPMALDAAGAVVAIAFRRPPRLRLYDSGTGAVIADLPVCGDADDVFFDDKRGRIYASCGEGIVAVYARDPAGWRMAGRVPTAAGARTALFVPERDRLYVAARAGLFGSDAAILVLRPQP
jgi:hypothetical protein